MTTARGTFEVLSGDEDVLQDGDGRPKLTRISGKQRFDGDLQGDGQVDWTMCYLPDGARFVGLQRFDGTVDGRSGALVLESVGDHDGKASTGTWTILEGSGSGALAGIRGRGSFTAPGGSTVSFQLDYELD